MLVTAGSVVGALLGLAHAVYVYRIIAGQVPTGEEPARGRGIYFAAWTLLLWVLFGTYVLVLWLAGLVLYTLFKVFR